MSTAPNICAPTRRTTAKGIPLDPRLLCERCYSITSSTSVTRSSHLNSWLDNGLERNSMCCTFFISLKCWMVCGIQYLVYKYLFMFNFVYFIFLLIVIESFDLLRFMHNIHIISTCFWLFAITCRYAMSLLP